MTPLELLCPCGRFRTVPNENTGAAPLRSGSPSPQGTSPFAKGIPVPTIYTGTQLVSLDALPQLRLIPSAALRLPTKAQIGDLFMALNANRPYWGWCP